MSEPERAWDQERDGWWLTVKASCRTCGHKWRAEVPAATTRLKCPKPRCKGWAIIPATSDGPLYEEPQP